MKNHSTFLLVWIILGFCVIAKAQSSASKIPQGYQLLYKQDFEAMAAGDDFRFADENGWKLSQDDEQKGVLELVKKNDYQPRVRSPHSIALIKDYLFGDFMMEVRLKQTGREYNHRDLCLFFGFKDPSNYYYVHMASVADPHAHNIFLVNDEPRVKIGEEVTDGVQWGNGWHTIRLVRKVEDGTIKVYFDDFDTPIMEAKDMHFNYGHIGFGSFDDTGLIDDVRIWGPGFAAPPKAFYEKGN